MDVIDFHIKNDYFVNIELSTEKCVDVLYPVNLLLNIPSNHTRYILGDKKVSKYIDNNLSAEIELVPYAMRLVVYQDIIFESIRRNIAGELILFDGEPLGDSLMELFPAPEDEEIQNQEQALNACIALLGSGVGAEHLAMQKGIAEGYEQSIAVIYRGGIEQ